MSLTDCFVSLWLPTASEKRLRTRTISNCRNPEWNETFSFQIQSQVKNVLELSVCDEDTVTPDDHLLTVLYDLTKLCFRKKTHVKFPLNTEGMEELEVEFLLEESPSPPESLITNGVLVVTVLPESPVALGPPVAAPLREQNCGKENQAQLGPLPQSPLGGRLTEARQREPGHGGGSSWAPAPGGKISGPSPHLPQPCPRNPLIKAPTSLQSPPRISLIPVFPNSNP